MVSWFQCIDWVCLRQFEVKCMMIEPSEQFVLAYFGVSVVTQLMLVISIAPVSLVLPQEALVLILLCFIII